MKSLKRFLYMLVVCAIFSSSISFAQEDVIYLDTSLIETFPTETNTIELMGADDTQTPISELEKQFIEDIIEGIKVYDPNIKLDATDYGMDNVNRIVYVINSCLGRALQYDYSDIFYVDLSKTKFSVSGKLDVIIIPSYMSAAEIATVGATLIAETIKVSEFISPDMSDAQKALVVHDYIARNYGYDYTYQSRTLSDMVLSKKGVCQGYSYLFKYLAEKNGIECINVPSDAHAHMWNKVNIDGEWFNVDVTHDDPNMTSEISHSHFLLNDSEMMLLADNSHLTWNEYQWDSVTPVEVSESDAYSYSVMHDIRGSVAVKDNTIYCIDNVNNICQLIYDENVLRPIYTLSSAYIWKPYGESGYMYNDKYTSLVSYNGDIYFNSPNKVFRLSDDYIEQEVYEYDGNDPSETYFYGIKAENGTLYAEYATAPNEQPTLVQIDVKIIETPQPTVEPTVEPTTEPTARPTAEPTPPPCSSETEKDEETGEVTVHLSIPEEVVEEVEKVTVFVAEYDEDGTLIGVVEREADVNELTFTPEDEVNSIKTFIWSNDGSPLSVAEIFNLYK